VLHLFKEKLRDYLRRCHLQKLRIFQLAELQVKDRSAITIYLVESSGHELLDALVLQEIVLEDLVNLVNLSPFYPSFKLAQCTGVVKVMTVKQTGINAIFENHLVDVVKDLRIVYLLDELV